MARSCTWNTKRPRRPPARSATFRAAAATLFMVVVAAGCGGSEETESFSEPIELGTTPQTSTHSGLEDDIVSALGQGSLVPRPESQLRCIAQEAIASVGADALVDAGAGTPGTFDAALLDPDARDSLVDAVLACADIGSLLLDTEAVGVAISADSVSCLADDVARSGLDERLVRAAVAAGPERALADNLAEIAETMSRCLSLQQIAQIFEGFGLVGFLPGS